jgi:hypothetical protein
MGHTSNLGTWHNIYGSKDLAWVLTRQWTLSICPGVDACHGHYSDGPKPNTQHSIPGKCILLYQMVMKNNICSIGAYSGHCNM